VDQPRTRLDGPTPPPLGRGDGLAGRLERWAAEARVDEAARARSRERSLRAQAEEEGSLAGVLADLGEAGAAVTVATGAGGRHRGTVRSVGVDFVALAPGAGPGAEVVVALAAVTAVRTGPGARRVVGDRRVDAGLRLLDVIVGLAAERERLRVVTAGGEAATGVLVSVGRDLAVVRGTGDPPAVAYLPLDAITEIVVGG
jgi:hypothetical protein